MRERFLRDTPEVRLGNLASNLLRLSSWARLEGQDAAAVGLMQEIAAMIEWDIENASAELANIQREICRWRRLWPLDAARSLMAFRARQMSDRVLELSGLAR